MQVPLFSHGQSSETRVPGSLIFRFIQILRKRQRDTARDRDRETETERERERERETEREEREGEVLPWSVK